MRDDSLRLRRRLHQPYSILIIISIHAPNTITDKREYTYTLYGTRIVIGIYDICFFVSLLQMSSYWLNNCIRLNTKWRPQHAVLNRVIGCHQRVKPITFEFFFKVTVIIRIMINSTTWLPCILYWEPGINFATHAGKPIKLINWTIGSTVSSLWVYNQNATGLGDSNFRDRSI